VKARAKDVRGNKVVDGTSSVHWCRKNSKTLTKRSPNKSSNKRLPLLLRRRKGNYFTCGKTRYFMEVLQADHLNKVNNGRKTHKGKLTRLDSTKAEAYWLCELLMNLPVVDKPIPTISMNRDNRIVIIKVNSSKDNIKSTKDM
jgi:hypothetical protein